MKRTIKSEATTCITRIGAKADGIKNRMHASKYKE